MAGNIKGITIEFKGNTTQLGKALSDVNSKIRTTDTALREVDRALKLDPSNVELLAQKEALLNNQIAQTKDKLELQKRAAEEAAQALEAGTITQEEYARLAAQVATTANKLEGLESAAQETKSALNGAGDKANEAGNNVKESGDKAKDAGDKWEKFGSVAKVACEAAAAAVAAVTAAVVAAGTALVNTTVDAAAFADEVLTASQVTGMTTDRIQELQYASELVDVSFETVSGSMARNIRSMESAASGTGDIAEAYAQLGVSVTDTAGNLRDSETVYWEAIDALGQISDRTERDALAMEIFGRSAQDLNPLIAQGSEGFAELAEEAHEAGYVMSGETLDAFGEFDDQLQRLKAGTTAAKNALGTVLLPVLTQLGTDGVDLLGDFTNGILEANGDIEAMGEVIQEMIPQLLDLISQALPTIVELGGSIIGALAEAILDNLDSILETTIELIETIAQGLIDHLGDLAPVVANLIVGIANFIIDNLPTIVSSAIEIVIAVVDGISRALPELIPAAVACVNEVAGALVDNVSELIPAALELMVGLALGLIAAIPEVLNTVPTIVSELQDEFDEFIPNLVEGARTWGVDLIQNFISGISASIGDVRSTVSSIASTVSDYLHFSVPKKGPLSDFDESMGADMIENFINGIDSQKIALQRSLVQTGEVVMNGMDYSSQLSGISDQIGSIGNNGTYVINVNVGSQRLAQAVLSAQQVEAYRSGGL